MADNYVECKNVNYKYVNSESAKNVLDDATLSVEKGSFTAIIGRNGSGKSTLAKCLNSLLVPDSGMVMVAGITPKNDDDVLKIRQKTGMVFQNPDNQIVSTIVEDDVPFGAENLGIEPDEIRKRVDDALMEVDMYEYRQKAMHSLSGGQKQRISIAGILAMKPECIIFDEPTAMLDPQGKREVMDIIFRLKREGITIILITHFMDEAAAADKIYVMNEGRIIIEGTPSEVFKQRERLFATSMDVPLVSKIVFGLREKGVDVPSDIVDKEGLVEFLCKYE